MDEMVQFGGKHIRVMFVNESRDFVGKLVATNSHGILIYGHHIEMFRADAAYLFTWTSIQGIRLDPEEG